MNQLTLTIVGNLTRDPELRFTPGGVAVARLTVAQTPRTRDSEGAWKDGEPTFLDCTVWRLLAEHVTESLHKGDRVIVAGRLRTERWEQDGDKRTRLMLDVDAIGPDLTYATAKVTKAARTGGPADDPWNGATRERPADLTDDEPPF